MGVTLHREDPAEIDQAVEPTETRQRKHPSRPGSCGCTRFVLFYPCADDQRCSHEQGLLQNQQGDGRHDVAAVSLRRVIQRLCEQGNGVLCDFRLILAHTGGHVLANLNAGGDRTDDFRQAGERLVEGLVGAAVALGTGLVEQLGGTPMPALGFAIGIERLIITMESQGCEFPEDLPISIYFASIGDNAAQKTAELALLTRAEGFAAEYDLIGRSVKAQMKYHLLCMCF